MRARHHAAWLAVLLLAGCSWLGLATPQTFGQRVIYAYSQTESARLTAGNLLVTGRISSGDARNVQQQADVARQAIDIADQVYPTDPAAAEAKLDATLKGLRLLLTYLETKQ